MRLYDLIMRRRSVRNFKASRIPQEIVDELLDAANNAPSGGNLQPLSIIIVEESERREALAKIVGDQPWVKNSPLSMIFCIDFRRLKRWADLFDVDFKGENAFIHFLIAYADLMAAAQNVVILAQGHGLGSVYVGTILDSIDVAREYFTMPEYVLPMMVLSLGYPKSVPKNIPKLKKDVIVHRERYQTISDDNIKKAFQEKYGAFEENAERYFQKVYVEVLEADAQESQKRLDSIKEQIKKMEIKNNAQFLFRLRYPSDEMVKLNRNLIDAFKHAGFDFFR